MVKKVNLFKIIISSVVMLALAASITASPAYALDDGAYIVSATATYADPATGLPVNGDTANATLGESMVASVMGDNPQALVEQTNGKTYVTVGFGLSSNIENVRITVQTSSGGGYSSVGVTNTGNSGSEYQHYMFEVTSTDLYISPIFYVGPMGRDVQFFIKLNMSTAASGTGAFNSTMIPAVVESSEEVSSEAESSEEEVIAESYTDPLEGASGLSIHKVNSSSAESTSSTADTNSDSSPIPYIIGICVVLVLGGGVAGFVIWKRKGGLS